MTGADIIQRSRDVLGEPSTNRFPTDMLLRHATDVQRAVAFDVDFPQATLQYDITGVRKYQLDTLTKILRTYIETAAGNVIELVPVDIPNIEGDILKLYDNTSQQVLGAPTQSPQWITEPPSVYPMPNVLPGGTVPSNLPYTSSTISNQRPVCALQGGWAIPLPPDIATEGDVLSVDCVPIPPDLTTTQQLSIFPRTFLMCIVWGVVKLCRISDQNQQYQTAVAEYDKEIVKLQLWFQNQLQTNKPKVFTPRTVRTDFSWGEQGGWGGSGWGGGW